MSFAVQIAPRMEWPRAGSCPVIKDWGRDALELLHIQEIPRAGSPEREKRRTRQGPLAAKACARGLLPYYLPYDTPRGKVAATAEWFAVPYDLDHVPLTVAETLGVANAAFSGIRRLIWTTWSCMDGSASVRVIVLGDRSMTQAEVGDLWWWGRKRLLDAGLPEVNTDGQPSVDSRAVDGRLFYLPSVPASKIPGNEKWGGVIPRGAIGSDDDLPLGANDILAEARAIRAAEEPGHIARWPKVPVPHVGSAGRRGRSRVVTSRTGSGPSGSKGTTHSKDFSTVSVPSEGVTLLTFAEQHLQPGEEMSIGSVLDPTVTWLPDERVTDYETARLHRDADGSIWLHDFRTGETWRHRIEESADARDARLELQIDQAMAASVLIPDDPETEAAQHLVLLEAEAEEHQDDDILRGVVLEDLVVDDVPESVSTPAKGGSSTTPGQEWTRANEGDLKESLTWVETYSPKWGWCPTPRRKAYSGGRIVTLPCDGYGCPVCGPRKVMALRAAAGTRTRRWTEEGAWAGAVVSIPKSMMRTLTRWVADNPEDRKCIGVAEHPDRLPTFVLMWADGHAPEGVLADRIEEAGALVEGDLSDAADKLMRGIDLAGWKHADPDRVCVLRGPRELKHEVSVLRDAILGKARALPRTPAGGDGVGVVEPEKGIDLGSRSIEAVMEEAEARTGCKTRVVESRANVKARSRLIIWEFVGREGGADQPDPDEVIRQMHADGFFRKKNFTKKAVLDLDLDADGFAEMLG